LARSQEPAAKADFTYLCLIQPPEGCCSLH